MSDSAEYRAVRESAGRIDVAWRGILEVTGRDRVRFLHGMCTNDIKKLSPGEGCMAAIVNRQGKMVAEIVVRVLDESLLLEMDRSNLQATLDALNRFIVADDVKLTISDSGILGIYGPAARSILGIPEMKDFHFVRQASRIISRNRILGEDGYDIIGPTGQAYKTCGSYDGSRPIGTQAYETLRIENGFPRWGVDMDSTMLPMEAGLEPIAISYTKGCYIGQEVIQRVKTYSESPRTLAMFVLEGATVPAPGAEVRAGQEAVGAVTSATLSPRAGRAIALGTIRKEHKAPGTIVGIGQDLEARVAALPWQKAL